MFGINPWLIIFAVVYGTVLWLIYEDARTRYPKGNHKPLLWVAVVFSMPFAGLVIYFLLRPEKLIVEVS